MALKDAAKELIWLKSGFSELKPLNNLSGDLIYSDSESAIKLSKNPEHHARTKHIDIQYHFVRDCFDKLFNLKYINTKEQLADCLTKGVDINMIKYFTTNINLQKYL